MTHQNYYAVEQIARDRRQKLLAKSRTAVLANHSNTANRRFLEPFLVSFAETLIVVGEKLKGRYEPRTAARLSTR